MSGNSTIINWVPQEQNTSLPARQRHTPIEIDYYGDGQEYTPTEADDDVSAPSTARNSAEMPRFHRFSNLSGRTLAHASRTSFQPVSATSETAEFDNYDKTEEVPKVPYQRFSNLSGHTLAQPSRSSLQPGSATSDATDFANYEKVEAAPKMPKSILRNSRDNQMTLLRQQTESIEAQLLDLKRQFQYLDAINNVDSIETEKEKAKALFNEKPTSGQTPAGPPSGPPAGPPGGGEYPGGRQVLIIMISILLGLFLVALDRTIIATAIPQMTDEWHSVDDIGWYGSAYMLTSCCSQLLIGRIYTFYTPKWVFLTLIAIFEVGSTICGAAPNSVSFIIGRAIAGIGSAGIFSGGMVLMVHTVPLAKRPLYQAAFGGVFGLASICGPLLGGAFTTELSWRWCFYINLPIGGVVFLVLLFTLKTTTPMKKDLPLKLKLLKLDPIGTFFLSTSIICLLLALQWGGSTYAWSNDRITTLLTLFVALFIGFVLVQVFMQDTATIPASVIKNRSVLSALWYVTWLASTMMVLVYYIPEYFQLNKGVDAVHSGIMNLPMVISLVVGSLSSGFIVTKIGYYTPMAIVSACLMPIGAGLISTWNHNTSAAEWICFQIIFGLGLGLGLQQAGLAAQTVLPKHEVPLGVSLMFLGQMLGGSVFVSAAQNVFASQLVKGVASIPAFSKDPASIVTLGATQLRSLAGPQYLNVLYSAYNSALRSVFLLATALSCLCILGAATLEWKSVKGKGKKPSESKA